MGIKIEKTKIKDLILIKPDVFGDGRGYFMESYSKKDLAELGYYWEFVQDNESLSCKGVLRGLHFQTKDTQAKLVRVIYGEVFDVAVDLRKGSDTYGHWQGFYLSGENKHQLYIPEGFAHGFLVTSDKACFSYKCTAKYNPRFESGILYNDEDLGIDWPIEDDMDIIISDKDRNLPRFKDNRYEYGEE